MTNLTTDKRRSGWPDGHLAEMLDAAQTHLLEDESAEAVAIWRQLISEGGEASDWGHLEYADYLLRTEQEDEAHAELAALMTDRQTPGLPWLLAAELLEDRGQLEEALRWYSAAVAALPAVDRTPIGDLTVKERLAKVLADDWVTDVRAGRRRTRWEMGIPLNESDLLARMGYAEAEEKVLGLSQLLSSPHVIDGKFQFRSRADFDSLREVQPSISGDEVDLYYGLAERVLREHEGGRVILLPRQTDVLSPLAQAAFRARSMFELVSVTSRCELGDAIEWPPGRNEPCWCESGRKYKRCCGGPLPSFEL
ncbi:SEC-C metal-binding domain-containing protein [Kribbella sp. NPDC051620]|uniref:SEC-C metal-binding domain-containing protein n=1 Tax=Kribbella sp. NPDC051620 TaxID=3364120 RepID=UPI0037A10C78